MLQWCLISMFDLNLMCYYYIFRFYPHREYVLKEFDWFDISTELYFGKLLEIIPNKRGLSCAKLSQQSIRFLGPMELFFLGLNCWWLNCWIIELLNCWIVDFLNCWMVKLLKCQILELLSCWIVELLKYWGIGLLNCWIVEVLKC